jgi:cyclase
MNYDRQIFMMHFAKTSPALRLRVVSSNTLNRKVCKQRRKAGEEDKGKHLTLLSLSFHPSAARELIVEIKKLTDKPVRYVVNTHFHWDHYQGNQAYPASWPAGVEIISSEATRNSIEKRGIPRVKHEIVTMPQEIERLETDLTKATDAKQKAELQSNLTQAEAYLAELKTMQLTLPTMTFDRSLIVRRKSRTVQILWLGRAHTDGDVFVFLPKEKVLITGDRFMVGTFYG